MKIRRVVMLFAVIVFGRVWAAEIPIANVQDLAANSQVAGGAYTLNSGDYAFDAMTSFSISPSDFAIAKAGSRLTLDNSQGSSTSAMLTVRNFTLDLGSLIAKGGATSLDYGLGATKFTMNSGSLTTTGGAASNAAGVWVGSGGMTIAGGTILATGGTGQTAAGITSIGAFSQRGGSITAIGGNSLNSQSYGLYAQGLYSMTAGTLNASGGSGNNASGVMALGGFTLTGGTINAQGGSGGVANGVSSQYNPFVQNGGVINAIGGAATDGVGIYAANLVQSAGALAATGGDAAGAYGVFIRYSLSQTGGVTTARGSATNSDGYGITLAGNATAQINGELRLERQADAASLFLHNGSTLTLGAGSTLVPVVDMGKVAANNADASGLIASDSGDVVINGARVTPYFQNTRGIALGTFTLDVPFISLSGTGTIAGDFLHQRGGYFFEYQINKNGTNEYVLTITHTADIEDEAPYLTCDNSRKLIGMMDNHLTRSPGDALFTAAWDYLENAQSEDDWRRRAAHVGRTLAPLAYTKLTQSLVRLGDLAQADFSSQLGYAAVNPAGAASSSAHASLAPGNRWHFWANPLYQQSSRFRAYCYEYDNAKEKFLGAATGLARDFGVLAVGGALHYVKGKYDADYSDIDTDNVGGTLGARLHDFVPGGGWFNPWAELALGYTRSDIDQDLMGLDFLRKQSSTDADIFRASLTVANPLELGGRLTLTPSAGVDYTAIRQGGYTETGSSSYLLAVSKGYYHSLKPKIGMEAAVRATDRLSVFARGLWRYETKDRLSTFHSDVLDYPDYTLNARGERLKRASLTLGAGLRYSPTNRWALSAAYDFLSADNYRAHRFNAALSIGF